MDQFKDNIMGLLVSEKKIKLFENIDTAVKAHFTKTFNNMNTSSIKLKKTKGSGPNLILTYKMQLLMTISQTPRMTIVITKLWRLKNQKDPKLR